MNEPTLFGEETATEEYQRPEHVDPSRCGLNETNYTKGCRCELCRSLHGANLKLYKRGVRICQHCGQEYARTGGYGGNKFCGECQANGVYRRHEVKSWGKLKTSEIRACERCQAKYQKNGGRARMWNLCQQCTGHPVFKILQGSLGQHNVPIGMVMAVMDWPYCANENCGEFLLDRAHRLRRDRSSSRYVYNFAIDHDHRCCPGERSCGQCVRGIVCRACNNAMPHTLDTPRSQGITDYLAAHG